MLPLVYSMGFPGKHASADLPCAVESLTVRSSRTRAVVPFPVSTKFLGEQFDGGYLEYNFLDAEFTGSNIWGSWSISACYNYTILLFQEKSKPSRIRQALCAVLPLICV